MPHYLVIDSETSGLFDYSRAADAPGQPRLAQFGMIFVGPDHKVEVEHEFLIKPEGWEMTEEATRVTGLTTERLKAEGVPADQMLGLYAAAIDARRIIVGHNVSFDIKMLRAELRRAGMEDRFMTTRTICTMFGSRDMCQIPNANGKGIKNPKLAEACEVLGIPQAAGHTALDDARSAYGIFLKMAEAGLPEPKNPYSKTAKPAKSVRVKKPKPGPVGSQEEIPL